MIKQFILISSLLSAVISFAGENSAPLMGLFEQQMLRSSISETVIQFDFPVSGELPSESELSLDNLEWKQPGQIIQIREDEYIHTDPVSRALLAVPCDQGVQWEIVSTSWHIRPSNSSAYDAVKLAENSIHRGVNLRSLSVTPIVDDGLLSSVVIKVVHRPAGVFANAKLGNRSVKSELLVLNPQILAACTAEIKRDPVVDVHPFSLTDNWIRLEINETAVYAVDGFDLAATGLFATNVDASKLRIYRAWPGIIPLNPDEPGSMDANWNGFTEIPIKVDSDIIWSDADRIIFYAVGQDCWEDRIDESVLPLDHVENPYASNSVYWLTWEDYETDTPLQGNPLRISTQDAAQTGENITTVYRKRMHLEESNVEAYGRSSDNWIWQSAIFSNASISFFADNIVSDSTAVVIADIRSEQLLKHKTISNTITINTSMWLNNGDAIGELVESEYLMNDESDSTRVRIVAEVTNMDNGTNILNLLSNNTVSPNSFTAPALLLDSADIFYWSELTKAYREQLSFSHWEEQVQAVNQNFDFTIETSGGEDIYSWDVTSASNPIDLNGSSSTGSYAMGVNRYPDTRSHYVLFSDSDLATPSFISKWYPTDLRSMDPDVQYVVVHDPLFINAANALASYRSTILPGYLSPRAVAVNTSDIYDCFGGGVKDPLAIRNFLEWLFDRSTESNADSPLYYACFLGDASRDYRHYKGQFEDFVPSVVRSNFPALLNNYLNHPYGSDDAMVSFDEPSLGRLDIPDLATGRLAVRTVEEADSFVNRIMAYTLQPEPGIWRNKVVLVADDLTKPNDNQSVETAHMRQTEVISNEYLPLTVDVNKLYLADYESPSGVFTKPLARQEARQLLNDGLSIFHYVGHGSDNVLADEQVFLTEDIYGLSNGMRRGVFLAFSCDVGIFDSSSRQSMAEVFTSQENGGAIAAIASSQVSWTGSNNVLSDYFYESLFPNRQVVGDVTLGSALLSAKMLIGATSSSQRYLLHCDPGLNLFQPTSSLNFFAGSSDTLGGGRTEAIKIILSDNGIADDNQVSYDLLVQESRQNKTATVDFSSISIDYWLPGATMFHGTGYADSDTLTVPFKVPLQIQYGEYGEMRLVVETPDSFRAVSVELPVAQVSVPLADDNEGPQISLAFEDNRYRVRAGDLLNSTLQDTSGISILGTNPGNSILLEFDSTGLMTDVSELFVFNSGSYSAGQLAIPLPDDLSLGKHTVALLASDVLGNVGSDTLSFLVGASAVTSIEDVTLFPNPTSGPARLLFEASDPMEINWDIYTTAGDHIWGYQNLFATAGPKIIEWDGRDKEGDYPANGVYLFVLQAKPLADDNHIITKTGHVVIMR
jgi:hypothetical protein